MNKIFLLLVIFSISCLDAFEHRLSICAIFQNEAPYLKEWIDYHLKVGVDHFYLYNNNSTDHYDFILKPYITKGVVTLTEWPSVQEENDQVHFTYTVQTGAYNHALKLCATKTKWLALIDTDEFIVPVNEKSIYKVLQKHFSKYAGVCVNWQCYGTSHVERCNSVLHELVWKMKWNHERNKVGKSIVKPLHVRSCDNPHFCFYLPTYFHVDCNFNKCAMIPNGVYIDKLRINHYWTRDEWFLHQVKIPRYLKWGNNVEGILKHAEEMNEEYDPILSNPSS
jgi:hypothetical protein